MDAGSDSELDYTEQTSWFLLLRYLDDLELEKKDKAELKDKKYKSKPNVINSKLRGNKGSSDKKKKVKRKVSGRENRRRR